MILTINGQKQECADEITLDTLLTEQGYKDMLVATARNGNFVPRSQYEATTLENGDEIEIVAPMQGG